MRTCAMLFIFSFVAASWAGDLPIPPDEAKYPNILRPTHQIGGSFGALPGQFNDVTAVTWLNENSVAVADTLNHRVQIVSLNGRSLAVLGGYGSEEGKLNGPRGVAADARGRIVVADTGNQRVSVFWPDGRHQFSFGRFGAGPGLFNEPSAVAISKNEIYVTDTNNRRVQVFDESGKHLRTIGADRTGAKLLQRPVDVAVSDSGKVFVVDHDLSQVMVFSRSGEPLGSWGSWGSFGGMLANPTGISWSAGRVFVADQINHRIQAFDESGKFAFQFGRHPIAPHEGHGRLHYVERLSATRDGTRVVACEPFENRCQVFVLGELQNVIAANESAWWEKATKFHYGRKAASDGRILAISEPDTHAVLAFDLTSDQGPKLITILGQQGGKPGEFRRPSGLAIMDEKFIYVSDSGNRRIHQFELQSIGDGPQKSFVAGTSRLVRMIDFAAAESMNSAGEKSATNGLNIAEPSAIRIAPNKEIFIVDPPSAKVVVVDQDFKKLREWGSFGVGSGQFRTPIDLALSPAGDRVYVVDHYNYRIQVFDPAGKFLASWGGPGPEAGNFVLPFGAAVHPTSGDVYVSDTGAHRIQQFTSSGKFIRQWGRWGVNGGEFYKPKGIAFDTTGKLYVTDFGNHRGQIFSATGDFIAEFGLSDTAYSRK
jgi:tripartite motif-containing protein 71